MSETKIDLTNRLMREGRWVAACEFRDRVRREQREAGKKRSEANDEAWRLMALEFPPLVPGSEHTADGDAVTELRNDEDDDFDESPLPENLPAGDGDFEADLRWAWTCISDDDVVPEAAPNGSAWYLLLYGRSNPEKFVPLVMKVLGSVGMHERDMRRDRAFQFALLANITQEFAGQEPTCEACGCSVSEPQSSDSRTSDPGLATT